MIKINLLAHISCRCIFQQTLTCRPSDDTLALVLVNASSSSVLFQEKLIKDQMRVKCLTRSHAPSLETFLLHGHSLCSLFPDVTEEAHRRATVGSGKSGSVAAFHVNTAAFITGLPRCPCDLFGLERSEVEAPMHVSRGAAVVRAIHPKIIQKPLITYG